MAMSYDLNLSFFIVGNIRALRFGRYDNKVCETWHEAKICSTTNDIL